MKKLLLLLVPALLMFVSCRSTKKGSTYKPGQTLPTTTIEVPSTTPSKTTASTTSSKKPDKQEPDLGKMKIPVGTNFTSKVKVTITQDGKDVTTNGTLRMRYDDVIQLSLVDPVLGIMEIGRMELSPQNILVIDRVHKRYVSTTYDEFTALKSRKIDYATIQEFFWQEAKKSDKLSYTIPAKRDIKLDLQLSNKGKASNWDAHTTLSGKYTKTDVNQLFGSMIEK